MKLFFTILALLYALSPFDILPERFFLGWGWIDDLIILWLLWRTFYSVRSRSTRGAHQQTSRPGEHASHSSRGASGDQQANQANRPTPEDPYAALGLSPGASREEIKSAYRGLALKYHPDKMAHLGDDFRALAEKRFKEIQEAYQRLKGK